MKTTNAAVSTAIRSSHEVKALPRLTAEWNMNRYRETEVDNTPSEESAGNDIDMFPIESIVEPIRPSKGINKAVVGNALIADKYTSMNSARFYVAGLEDKYKYWASPFASDASGNITGVAPRVIYSEAVSVNKIVVGLENTWASPTTWSIQTTANGSTWTTASSAPAISADGRAVLYWNGSNWGSTKPASLTSTTTITGIRVVVTRLGAGRDAENNVTKYNQRGVSKNTTGARAYFNLIEISARLEMDLSDRLESVSDTFDGGDASMITPVGTITSNVGSVTLWNGDGLFNNENASSSLKGLIDANVQMNLEYVYEVGGQKYPVQQFKFFSDTWTEGDESLTTVALTDHSKYLKEIYPQPAKYEDLTLSQIFYRLCDSIGFTDYNILRRSVSGDFRIPIFWVDGTQTIWEVFDELATTTQSLVYFDAWGQLNVKPREAAFNKTRPVDWTLRSRKSGTELPDIISLEKTDEYQSNLVKIKYKDVGWADVNNGHVQMVPVWSPDDTVSLRATQLTGALSKTADYIPIAPDQAKHWPYEGHVQIEGEFIEYSGKWFKYRDGGTWKTKVITNQKEYDECNEKTNATSRHQNHFLGRLKIKERGVWNTDVDAHTPEAKGWTARRYPIGGGSVMDFPSDRFHAWRKNESVLRLRHGGSLPKAKDMVIVSRGANNDTGWRHFGARFKFNGSGLNHRGGIVFNHRNGGEGYYIELRPTNTIANKDRNKQDEITLYSIKNNVHKKVGSDMRKPDLIVADTWHDIDVYYNWAADRITIYLDGKLVYRVTVPAAQRHPAGGKFGMFIRGKTVMDFEYIYAVAREPREPADDAGFYDRVRGAFTGDMWNREWVYKSDSGRRWVKRKGKWVKKKKTNVKFKRNLQFFDDFGPYVHEVREFNVTFDPAPVRHSRLFFTNDWDVVCPEYRSTAFGAYFILANASRRNAVVSGDDSLTFAISGDSVQQQLTIYGNAVVMGEQEEIEVKNEAQIRARGEIVTEIDSPWMQSEEAAQAVGDWIIDHWSEGADQLTASIFGNPLLEVGDVVAVQFPERSMTTATHQYFVIGIDTEFDSGITTQVTLRRKN